MRVLIVAKTKMQNGVCVGAVTGAGRAVRLLQEDGHQQDHDFSFNVGDVVRLDHEEPRYQRPPHVEDILVSNMVRDRSVSSIESIADWVVKHSNIEVFEGDISNVFNGKLQWTDGGTGYISRSGGVPSQSTGFWIPDQKLRRQEFDNGKIKYCYDAGSPWRKLAYVGFQTPLEILPCGKMIRVSLARWWTHDPSIEDRCYLQLSGWYF